MSFSVKEKALFILLAGTQKISDYREVRAIILLNSIAMLALMVVVYFIFFYLMTENFLMLLSVVPMGGILISIPVLNYLEKSTISKYLIFTAGSINIMMSVWWLGVRSEVHHYYYVMIVATFVCFSQDQKRSKLFFLVLSAVSLIVIKINPEGMFSGTLNNSESTITLLSVFSIGFAAFLIIAMGEVMSDIVQSLHFQSLQEKARKVEVSRLEAINTLSGGVAHEINNPLAIISSVVDRLDKLDPHNPEDKIKEKDLKFRIKNQVSRISSIVKNLRSFSEKSDLMTWGVVSPAILMDECIELCSAKLSKFDIRIENLIDRNISLYGSKSQLMQLFISLIVNSIDSIKLLEMRWIRLESQPEGQYYQIRITDSGAGIDSKIRDRIMQPFFTTREPGQGTGLGLTLATSIAEQHGGTIMLDHSSRQNNTCFIVLLMRGLNSGLNSSVKKSA